jgi:anti-sigma regulatory factor (Ser/Thr protein kinase)
MPAPARSPHPAPAAFTWSFRARSSPFARPWKTSRRHVLLATDDPELTGDAQIVLAEVMNNIVEHALAARSDGVIEVILRVEPSGIDCMLRDDGCAMPGGRLPDAVATPVIDPRAEPREGGFGWPLVRALAGDLAYRRQGEWNETRLTVPCRTAGTLVARHPA